LAEITSKKKNKQGKNSLSNRLRSIPGRCRRLTTDMLKIHALWMVVFMVVCLALFYQHYRPEYVQYELGQVAKSDIRATVEVAVPDQVTTDLRRQEAISAVLPVYDYDPRADKRFTEQLRNFFFSAREVISPPLTVTVGSRPGGAEESVGEAESEIGKIELTPELVDILAEMSPFNIDQEQIAIFHTLGFSPELQSLFSELAAQIYRDPFVEDHENLIRRGGGGGVTILNITTAGQRTMEAESIKDRQDLGVLIDDELAVLNIFDETERPLMIRFLNSALDAPLTFNLSETNLKQEMAAATIPEVVYRIPQNKMIVREGDLITADILAQLEALEEARKIRWGWINLIGIAIILIMVLAATLHFLDSHRRTLQKFKNIEVLVLIVLTLSLAVTELSVFIFSAVGESLNRFPFNNVHSYYYMIPFSFGGLLLSLITSRRVALFFTAAYSLLAALLLEGSFLIVAYSLAGNFMAIYGPLVRTKRTALMKSGIFLGSLNALVVATLYLLQPYSQFSSRLPFEMACAFVGGVISILLVFSFLPLFESLFHLVTDFRLLELSNLDSPLLRELALRAPGTYHHSVIVGHLAETAAKAIGANALFVRVASYYHDIGKMFKPEYFIENLGSTENKHDRLAPRMSALILTSHVKEGIEIATQHNIVPAVIDIIPQHHGTRLMTFFFNKAKDKAGDQQQLVKEEDYRYKGPKPQTNEAAVIMLADAVEAASRTLTDPSSARLKGLVQKIINTIVLDRQLDECNLTFKDLETISGQFLRILGGIFHQRVDYPGFNFQPGSDRSGDSGSHPPAGRENRGNGGKQQDIKQDPVRKGGS